MQAISTRLFREIEHFRSMPETARVLTLSYFFRSIAYPMMSIFTGAFIWKTTSNISLLILYYIGCFATLPLMFILNRQLLFSFPLKNLYLAGTVISGFGPLLVVLQRSEYPLAFFVYGVVYGIGIGLYWANRNFLTLTHTTSTMRSYFTGLQFSLSTLAAMIVPPIAGWFVVNVRLGYELLIPIASGIFITSGLIIRRTTIKNPDISAIRRSLSPSWNTARLLSIAMGCVDSIIYILPTVLVLHVLGSEIVLGWINGVAALLSAIASYVVGRKYKQSMFVRVFTAMLIGFVISGFPFFANIGIITVSWYILISSIVDSIIWIANEPVLMDMMDEEVNRSRTTHYRLVVERELFLNIGRVSMLLLFLATLHVAPAHAIAIAATSCGLVGLGITGWILRTRSRRSLMPRES